MTSRPPPRVQDAARQRERALSEAAASIAAFAQEPTTHDPSLHRLRLGRTNLYRKDARG
jgi:hypothetical protein